MLGVYLAADLGGLGGQAGAMLAGEACVLMACRGGLVSWSFFLIYVFGF